MERGDFRIVRITALVAAIVALAFAPPAFAAGSGEEEVPSTSIVPAEGPSSAPAPANSPAAATVAPAPAGAGAAAAPGARTRVHHAPSHTVHAAPAPEIEPAQARLKLLKDTPVYSAPTKSSKQLTHATMDMFIVVTGSTHYFLRVQLKDGQTGYIEPSAVELVKPTDKVFVLTHDAAVLDKPNRWSMKVAEVHQGRNVHIIGIALNYMQIRMKNGLQGFIPVGALE